MDGIEISEKFEGGFKILAQFEQWRVAMLKYADRKYFREIHFLEKHLLTDEVFVLLNGRAILIIGENAEQLPMEPRKVYNVKKGTWHAVFMDPEAEILLVENADTGRENSEYLPKDVDVKFD